MSQFTVRVRYFRALEQLDWSPQGVCILSGPNGAGKTTTLDVFRFLRAFFTLGPEEALRAVDGIAFKSWGDTGQEPVIFEVEVADVLWRLQLPMSAQGMMGIYGEELSHQDKTVLHAPMFQQSWYLGAEELQRDERRCCARVLADRGSAPWIEPLRRFLEDLRTYDTYWLNQVKRVEPVNAADSYLHTTGRNLWSVLANWKGAPLRYDRQFDWVMSWARKAFPEIIGEVEFDRGLPYLFKPGATDPSEGLLPNRAADGLLTGLLHLTAIAGAKDNAFVAFDEIENQLHPHAIRILLQALRERADERGLTVVLTTHSPVVLNEFWDDPEQVFVLKHEHPEMKIPARITELHTEQWLAQEKLGALYERLAFSSPLIGSPK